MRSTKAERDDVAGYFESQSNGDRVVHLDKLASERVGSTLHDVWDVHSTDGRWWVITNPLNLYTQEDFKSADVALTFHIGLMARVMTRHDVPIAPEPAALLPEAWRRWEHAVDTLSTAAEAEDFQSVGMQLRECLIGFAGEVASDDLVSVDQERPQQANVVAWCELLASKLTSGSSSRKLRSYLKTMSQETWDYVNWLTHARNADPLDAEIGVASVSHLLATFSAARLRWARRTTSRCGDCASNNVSNGQCRRCGWIDPEYQAPTPAPIGEDERERRLAEPCTPSSDVSTFVTPDDYR